MATNIKIEKRIRSRYAHPHPLPHPPRKENIYYHQSYYS